MVTVSVILFSQLLALSRCRECGMCTIFLDVRGIEHCRVITVFKVHSAWDNGYHLLLQFAVTHCNPHYSLCREVCGMCRTFQGIHIECVQTGGAGLWQVLMVWWMNSTQCVWCPLESPFHILLNTIAKEVVILTSAIVSITCSQVNSHTTLCHNYTPSKYQCTQSQRCRQNSNAV